MLIKRLYDEKLAQASYLVGCAATGEALVVDPSRDIEQYMAVAAQEGMRITHVTETHIHADFVSGLRELATRTGARAYLSREGGPDWSYRFAAELGAELVGDGDEFRVGNIRVQVLHTPGHTPEHISFLITDTAGADRPMGVFTGDFVFVGDVGRPDLLERAAGVAGTMESGARQLYGSLQRLKQLPEWLQLWPGHGAGSACGKALGAVPQSTLGYERQFNWGLATASEQEFVSAVLSGQPEPPRYFAEMKRINRDGPRVLGGFPRPPRLDGAALERLLAEGAPVIDVRPWSDFRDGHVRGTLSIPLNRSFTTWAGSLLRYDRPFYLLLGDDSVLTEAVRDLAMIGLDDVAGWFGADVLGGRAVERVSEVDVSAARALVQADDVAVLDVRGESEWQAGHLPATLGAGVQHIPLGSLPERLGELPRDGKLLVHCKAGSRSAIATSLLQAAGFTDVVNLAGGYDAWLASGAPVEMERAAEPVHT